MDNAALATSAHICGQITGDSPWILWPLSTLAVGIFAAAMLLVRVGGSTK